ncbi:MAG TPA: hypothetical protein VLF89_06810 [Candidatus Saccharimonadales bacterium]|nr:hypothetical protein [Candidatus Saccharimonadales bacterium]HSW97507.1 hypothetical protein [Candidatus Saccharimonadales bacterium]
MDTAQLLMIIVVVVLTGLLLILGIQVYFILNEFRKTLAKANKVIDDIELLAESIANPLAKLATLTSSFKTGAVIASALKLLPFFQSKKHSRREEEEEE